MDKILVTGASGTIGKDVLGLLREASAPVVGASSRPSREPGWVEFDFLRPETFEAALDGVTRVFFMRPPALANVPLHFGPFLDRLERQPGLEAVVFLSLQGAEKNPLVPHNKLEKELDVRGLPRVFLRPSFFMQNLSGIHRDEIRLEDAIRVPAGKGRTAFIDGRDIAEIASGILVSPASHIGKAYELTGPESLGYGDVAAILSRESGRTITYSDPGFLRFYLRQRARGTAAGMALVMCALYGACRFGQAARKTGESESLLGRPPRDFADFARDSRESWA